MRRFFQAWVAFTKLPIRFYGIGIVLGAVFLAGGTYWRSWLGAAFMFVTLIGLLLLAAPLYALLDDNDE